MIAAEYSNSKTLNAPAASVNWHGPATRPQYVVHCAGLSDEARDYLRQQVRAWRQAGHTAATAAAFAQSWCSGYRWFGCHPHERIVMASAEFIDGYEFAHGQDMYLECMIIDQCQDSSPYNVPGYAR